ncbi:MAG TPA: ATP-binding protein [Terracidiphilus sp.]|nr:ATP-binding protein [Terracidiphilus sp.]
MTTGQKSISFRLTLWFGGIFLLGWVLFGATMWFNLKHTLTEERHLTLSRRIDRLQMLLVKTQTEDAADRLQDYNDFAHATGGGLVEVFHRDGSLAFPSPSDAAKSFPWPSGFDTTGEHFVQVQSTDQPYWVLVRPVAFAGESVYLAAAAPEAGNILVLERFWEGLLAAAPLLLLISSAGGYWLSRRALQPVDRITATARSISIRNLSERLPVAASGDELERLTATFNAMLDRLESAVNQIKQFTADASHELRGPLSFVRTVAEVALRNAKADPESRKAFEDIVEEAAKASVLLEDMLTLARAEAERGDIVLEPLNLSAVVQDACERARPLAAERRLGLSTSVEKDRETTVLGDFSALRRLLLILLDNALKYTPHPGQIDVALTANLRQATVTVQDTGSGIAEKDLPHIFDRFYRADPSRSQIEGSGLGLAIAKWIADLHHADLTVTSHTGQGSVFRLVLPLHTPSQAH